MRKEVKLTWDELPLWKQALIYPYSDGWFHLFNVALLLTLGESLFIIGWFIFFYYVWMYFYEVIQSSCRHERFMPNWPLWHGFQIDLGVGGYILLSGVCVFLPVFLYRIGYIEFNAFVILSFICVFIYPMAALKLCLYGTIAALNPIEMFRSIKLLWKRYILGVIVFWCVWMLVSGSFSDDYSWFFNFDKDLSFFQYIAQAFIKNFCFAYFMCAFFRYLSLAYLEQEDDFM